MEDDFDHTLDSNYGSSHDKVIVHLDADCFYAQVEMLKNPELRTLPLGVQQKNLLVTCNYVARQFGVKKCMLVSDAKRLCPSLILVKGEDLYDYRQMSTKMTLLLQKFSPLVEKLGLDENFVDVTQLVAETLKSDFAGGRNVEGHVYGDTTSMCDCGCYERLCVGSQIASEMRKQLKEELGVTCCAGVAYNKLLAKLVCSTHKPNQQTTLFPAGVSALMLNLNNVRSLPGIGHRTSEILQSLGISSIEQLQNINLEPLEQALGRTMAERLKKLSVGADDMVVKPSGKPQSIGLEDGFRKITLESEVKDKCEVLLQRLMILLVEDGRIPGAIRVTVRKYDNSSRYSHRESRQCNIPSSLFLPKVGTLPSNAHDKLLTSIMKLFHKIIDISKPFHLTLLGVAFTKFHERNTGKGSITSFLVKDISVQSVMNFQNISLHGVEAMECSSSKNAGKQSGSALNYADKSGSESEPEPSPKKTRADFCRGSRKRSLTESDKDSPNKHRSSELRLSTGEPINEVDFSKLSDGIQEELMESCMSLPSLTDKLGISDNSSPNTSMSSEDNFQCPSNVDPTVFRELPQELQLELIESWQTKERETLKVANSSKCLPGKPKQNSILKYVISKK
uniref:UmuC domain-containing protein n=1 Tax=Timema genevievae TaxID=629358 RepID=A0A7R9PMG6_TIMGE|nr:unnamed protein product [Timema genevievae]